MAIPVLGIMSRLCANLSISLRMWLSSEWNKSSRTSGHRNIMTTSTCICDCGSQPSKTWTIFMLHTGHAKVDIDDIWGWMHFIIFVAMWCANRRSHWTDWKGHVCEWSPSLTVIIEEVDWAWFVSLNCCVTLSDWHLWIESILPWCKKHSFVCRIA